MDDPEVTIIMPVFNAERYLREAIDSILQQTFTNFELIIVNDASTDSSGEIIDSYNDPRIRTIVHERNSGPTESRNAGLRMARGKYIAPMDADDISEPQRLERQVSFLRINREIALLATWGRVINECGDRIKEIRLPLNPYLLRWKLLLNNQLIHSSVMFPVAIVSELGGYRPLEPSEDYDLYSRIIMDHPLRVIPEHLILWRNHAQGLSCKEAKTQNMAAHVIAHKNTESILDRKIPLEDILALRAVLTFMPISPSCDLKRSATLLNELFHAAVDRWNPDHEGYVAMAEDCSKWLAGMASIAAESSRVVSLHILRRAVGIRKATFAYIGFWKSLFKIILGPLLTKAVRNALYSVDRTCKTSIRATLR